MITLPNGKICMNEQEAIQWLLDNFPIPFQCSANYVGGAEIGLGTIVNPTPAKVRVGSIIFFADSKVSTVVSVNSNSFVCSDQYNDLVDDVVYVSNVQLNASGHLIVTLSNGDDIDAGLIKQVTSFSINASQHLIATYNDGTSSDLGAIFNGNVNIAGNFTADSIIENMTGYTFSQSGETTNLTREFVYASVVKNGNKLTCVIALNVTRTDTIAGGQAHIGFFGLPAEISAMLYPTTIGGGNYLDMRVIHAMQENASQAIKAQTLKTSGGILCDLLNLNDLTVNEKYYVRYEFTFLLSDNMA